MGVTAQELIAEAERRGARFHVVGNRLEATPSALLDNDLSGAIGEHKADVIALLRERSSGCTTHAVLFAQALLRQGRFPLKPAPCGYHCGYPQERCRCCGAAFSEHCALTRSGDA